MGNEIEKQSHETGTIGQKAYDMSKKALAEACGRGDSAAMLELSKNILL